MDDDEEEEEEAGSPSGMAYASLMKSLSDNAPPTAKRRKLAHNASEQTLPQDEPASEPESADEDEDEEGGEGQGKDVDLVEEAEEDQTIAPMEDLFDDDEEGEADTSDPFDAHFANPDEKVTSGRLRAAELGQWDMKRVATKSARITISSPKVDGTKEAALPGPITGPSSLKLKQKLADMMSSKRPKFDATEQEVAPLLFNYYDTLYCERTPAAASSLRRMAALHALNHVFK